MGPRLVLMLSLAVLALPHRAWAVACTGPLPQPGQSFSGLVRFVIDGDRFCMSDQVPASTWVQVRLSDFRAARLQGPGGEGAKWALRRAARGKQAACTAKSRAGGRVVALCHIDGVSIGDILRRSGGAFRGG